LYESTGVETRFTNGLDPEARSRATFAFHRPEILIEWLNGVPRATVLTTDGQATPAQAQFAPGTFRARVRNMPPLADKLWPPKPQAIANIEKSLAANRPRALVQMATGSGKTLLAIVLSYRL